MTFITRSKELQTLSLQAGQMWKWTWLLQQISWVDTPMMTEGIASEYTGTDSLNALKGLLPVYCYDHELCSCYLLQHYILLNGVRECTCPHRIWNIPGVIINLVEMTSHNYNFYWWNKSLWLALSTAFTKQLVVDREHLVAMVATSCFCSAPWWDGLNEDTVLRWADQKETETTCTHN